MTLMREERISYLNPSHHIYHRVLHMFVVDMRESELIAQLAQHQPHAEPAHENAERQHAGNREAVPGERGPLRHAGRR